MEKIRRPTREKIFEDSSSNQLLLSSDSILQPNFDESSAFDRFSSYTAPESRITLAWSHLSVEIDTHQRQSTFSRIRSCFNKELDTTNVVSRKPLLRSVYGLAKPGRILTIIGSSGAGKSTLMNVLLSRGSRNFHISGKVKANGAVIGKGISKVSAYLQQDDLFHPNLTVGSCLRVFLEVVFFIINFHR